MDIKNKKVSLPQSVSSIIDSDLDPKLNLDLAKKYSLSQDKIKFLAGLLYGLFSKQILLADLPVLVKKSFNLDDQKTLELVSDIIGRRLLVFDSYFDGQAVSLLKKVGGQVKDYQQYIDEQRKLILEEAKELSEASIDEKEISQESEPVVFTSPNAKTEKEDALKIFSTRLVPFLEAADPNLTEIIFDYNTILIEILDQEPALKDKLLAALADNSEKITAAKIIVKGRLIEPTVGNWVKYFFEKNGNEYFDNLKITEFLNYSSNTKKLNKEERMKLLNLFTLYRNLKFFPQSLANTPFERWQIIPFSASKEPEDKKTAEDGSVEKLTELERRALSEE